MKYRGGDRFGLPENEQMLIYSICRNYRRLSPSLRDEIDADCRRIGGDREMALRETVTEGRTMLETALRYHISEAALYKLTERFYKEFRWKI